MTTAQTNQMLEDLLANAERQSRPPTWDDVHQLVLDRSLALPEAVEVWQAARARFALDHADPALEPTSAEAHQKLLTPRQEGRLLRRVAAARIAGDADRLGILPGELREILGPMGKEARDRLVLANTRLVKVLVWRIGRQTVDFDYHDLLQEGIVGLLRAIQKFDLAQGYRFTTFAHRFIRHQLHRAFDNQARLIRLPSHVEATLRRLYKERCQLVARLHRLPTVEELARELGVAERKVLFLLRVERDANQVENIPYRSWARVVHGSRQASRSGFRTEIERRELSNLLQEQLRCLPPRLRLIVLQLFGLEGQQPCTQRQLGQQLRITRKRISQLKDKALDRLARGREGRALETWVRLTSDG
jgi:RNA polymerase sigma factor (sigma-70 family)